MELPSFEQAPWHRGVRTALSYRDEHWDYAELSARAATRAEELRGQGLASGQVVLVADAPGPELIVMQYALARLGAVLLPACPQVAASPDSLIAAAGVEWQWRTKAGQPGRLVSTGLRPTAAALPSPLALIVRTSGSSGSPRAVMLSQENVLTSCALVNARLDLRAGDRWLCCLPRHHVGGLAVGYRCAAAGARLIVHDGFVAAHVRTEVERSRVTHISLVPPLLARLLELDAPAPKCLRVVLVGGQALHPALAEQAIRRGWPLRITYGMTETCSQIATSDRLRAPPDPGVIGVPLPGVQIRCPNARTAPGPISVSGAPVMVGYANPCRSPGLGLRDGWLRTEDLGTWTAAGALKILGRADEVLVVGGHQVSPFWVEAELTRAPGVSAAVVIGAEHPIWGHSLLAVYAGSSDEGALERWCRGHLASHARPRRFRRLAELPLLGSGKYDRKQIRRLMGLKDA